MDKTVESYLQKNFAENLEFWMTDLPQPLKIVSIIHLAIPGSHDSFTSEISNHSKIAPDTEKCLQHLSCFFPFSRTIISRWSRTQRYTATEQLRSGIRYFDLRIATKVDSHELFFVHGLYSSIVDNVLKEISQFLDAHPHEVVILDCQHFYGFTLVDHQKLICLLTSIFGPKILPYSPYMEHITLEFMTTQFRYQVIMIYRSDVTRFGQLLLWPSASFPNPWPNTISIPHLISALEKGLIKRNLKVGFISQCVLTPTNWFVFKHLLSTLQVQCVVPLEKVKYQWVANQKPGNGGVNIIISDFIDVDACKFSREVIELNCKLLYDHHFIIDKHITFFKNDSCEL